MISRDLFRSRVVVFFVLFGHNCNDNQVFATQTKNFAWFGWDTPAALSFNWQFTSDVEEESLASYQHAIADFEQLIQLGSARKTKH